jgi:uncharacterized protein YjbJ (UPF0337 family)
MSFLQKVRNALQWERASVKKRTGHAADDRDLPAEGETGQVTGNSTKPAETVVGPLSQTQRS